MTKHSNDLESCIARHGDEESLAAFVTSSIQPLVVSTLTRTILAYLDACPHLRNRRIFESILELNQGSIDDLSRADFVSYLCDVTKLSSSDIAQVRQALRTFTTSSSEDTPIRMAARGGSDLSSTDASELELLLSKRIS